MLFIMAVLVIRLILTGSQIHIPTLLHSKYMGFKPWLINEHLSNFHPCENYNCVRPL